MACHESSDLPPLEEISSSLVPPPRYEDKDIEELLESISLIIADFVTNRPLEYMYEDFRQRVLDYTREVVEVLHNAVLEIFSNIDVEYHLEQANYIYFNLAGLRRSQPTNTRLQEYDQRATSKILRRLRNTPQPQQRTPEWYEFRHQRLTASSIWKALEEGKTLNQLIYAKCKPINRAKYSKVNITSPMHHGHKYEPVSIQLYERDYDTVIEEFGCLPCPDNPCIGASPDGINVKKGNPRYGRLLEVKNPVGRVPTGRPKKDYWVQMQIQMAVTGLHICDFLETVIIEYPDEATFVADGTFTQTADGRQKGIIICFHDGSRPVYEYPPLGLNEEQFDKWMDEAVTKNSTMTWTTNSFWHLAKTTCSVVEYNDAWFQAALPKFEKVWEIIERERKSGYEHRAPTRRSKKKKDIVPATNVIMKVRTESFDLTPPTTSNSSLPANNPV